MTNVLCSFWQVLLQKHSVESVFFRLPFSMMGGFKVKLLFYSLEWRIPCCQVLLVQLFDIVQLCMSSEWTRWWYVFAMFDIVIVATWLGFTRQHRFLRKHISDVCVCVCVCVCVYRLVVPCSNCGFLLKPKTPSVHAHTQGVCIADVSQTWKNWFML